MDNPIPNLLFAAFLLVVALLGAAFTAGGMQNFCSFLPQC